MKRITKSSAYSLRNIFVNLPYWFFLLMWVWVIGIAPQGAFFNICCRTCIPAANSVFVFHLGCLHLFLIVKIWIQQDFLEFLKCFDLLLTFVVDGLCECCVTTSTIYQVVDNCALALTFCLHTTPKSPGTDAHRNQPVACYLDSQEYMLERFKVPHGLLIFTVFPWRVFRCVIYPNFYSRTHSHFTESHFFFLRQSITM